MITPEEIGFSIRQDMESIANMDIPSFSSQDCEALSRLANPFPDLPPPMHPFMHHPWHRQISDARRSEVVNRVGRYMFDRLLSPVTVTIYRRCLSGARFAETYMFSKSKTLHEYDGCLVHLLGNEEDSAGEMDGLLNALTTMNLD